MHLILMRSKALLLSGEDRKFVWATAKIVEKIQVRF
jgi:hypothetical protein